MSAVEVAWFSLAFLAVASLATVCSLKGKPVAALASIVGSILPPLSAALVLSASGDPDAAPYVLAGICGCGLVLFALTAAARLAKPQSWWAQRLYNSSKAAQAQRRFGGGHSAHAA
jgi:hypothetical protein